jgi:hypothetical protein
VLAPVAFGQTELWRISGYYPVAIPGDLNCIYLSHGFYSIKDTLKKVNSAGSIIWQTPMLRRGPLSFNGSGLYASIGSLGSYSDSIAFYDLLGNVSWYFNTNGRAQYRIATDAGGNLFLLVETNSGQMTLLKVNASGTKLFQAPIIPPELRNYAGAMYYDGPFVDNTGKAWVIGFFSTEVIEPTLYKNDGYMYLYQFDGNTGNLLLQKKLLKEKYYEDKTATSYFSHFELDYPYLSAFGFSNGRLVLSGQYHTVKEKYPVSGIGNYEDLSGGRLMVIEPTGKGKMFKYKGKGILKCATSDPKMKDDFYLNTLYGIRGGTGDAIYLPGSFAARPEGDHCLGTSNLHADGALMRFNTAKKKPVWVNNTAFLDKGGYLQVAVTKSEKLLVWMGGTTLNVYDNNGNVGSTVLNFLDPFSLYDDFTALNATEDNVLYLNTNSTPRYFAKYSLPPVTILPGTLPKYEEDMPAEYVLSQNYPNPFNPTTTISFTLQQTSFVTLKVYNMLGQEVATLINHEMMDDGMQDVEFDASSLTSGAYFYRLTAEEIANEEEGIVGNTVTSVKKMLLLK